MGTTDVRHFQGPTLAQQGRQVIRDSVHTQSINSVNNTELVILLLQ